MKPGTRLHQTLCAMALAANAAYASLQMAEFHYRTHILSRTWASLAVAVLAGWAVQKWPRFRAGFLLVPVNSFNEWNEGTAFEPMKSYRDLTGAERALYHNPVDGAYRLDTLKALMGELG